MITFLLIQTGSIIYFWGDSKSHPPKVYFFMQKIGISFSLLYNISNDTNKKGLKHIPILDYTEFFTNIKANFIHDVVFDEESKAVIYYIKLPRVTHACPICGSVHTEVKGYYTRTIKLGTEVSPQFTICKKIGKYKQRRYRCNSCGKTFNEKNSFISKHFQMSKAVIATMMYKLQGTHTYTDIAKELDVSTTTVIRMFTKTFHFGVPDSLPTTLAIDEFRGNAGGQKFQVIVTNPKGKRVLDILPERSEVALFSYFTQFSLQERSKVRYLVMDMSEFFRSKMRKLFPQATIIADRFHLVRLVGWGFENVRKREQKRLKNSGSYIKRSRKLCHKAFHTLSEGERIRLFEVLRKSDDLRLAYVLKHYFEHLFTAKGRTAIEDRLSNFLSLVKVANLSEFNNLLRSFTSWHDEIVNAFLLPYSNGFTKGCNNKTKVLKRNSYGVRHFGRFRARLLMILPSIYNKPDTPVSVAA